MSFIVKKKIHEKEYYYLNENRREKGTGKVKTKTLAYLGKNRKDAEKKARELQDKKITNIKHKILDVLSEKKTIKIGAKIDEITSIASKRGFFFQTANIYGGKAGFFTYGHLGKALKANWEEFL